MEASDYAPIERGISNIEFLRGLSKALTALIVSATILITTFLVFYPHAAPSKVQNRVISGNELSVVFGGAGKSSTALQLAELSKDGRAILAHPIRLQARDYPFLEYNILNRSAGQTIYLLWRTKDNPKETSSTRLYWNGDRPVTLDLSKNEAWTGEITELAFDIYGDLRGQPIEFHQLVLRPYSASALLSTIWSEWVTYRGWTQRSAHHLRGTQPNSVLSPTLAMASWAGLALSLLIAANAIQGRYQEATRHAPTYVAVLLIPWIALDMLWQSELATQLDETKTLFGGKTQHEKHLAEREGALYEYAKYLKVDVLPAPGAKILLLHDSDHRTYTRLKAQYYLLPHNVFNYDRVPRKNATDNADYILALGDIRGLQFSAETHTLNWADSKGKTKTLKVALIDTNPLGTLYKIVGREG